MLCVCARYFSTRMIESEQQSKITNSDEWRWQFDIVSLHFSFLTKPITHHEKTNNPTFHPIRSTIRERRDSFTLNYQ